MTAAIRLRAFRPIFVLALAGLILAICAAKAVTRFDGTVSFTRHQMGIPTTQTNYRYSVWVDRCSWKAGIHFTNNSNWHTVWESGSTNAGEYYVHMRVNGKIWTGVHLYSGHVPTGADVFMNKYLWSMFASGCVLDQRTTNSLHPIFYTSAQDIGLTNFTVPAKWRMMKENSAFPEHISWWNNNVRYVVEDIGSTNMILEPLNSRAPDGFTNAAVYLLATTNLNGSTYPAAYEYHEYGPPPGVARDAPLDLIRRVEARVNSIQTGLDASVLRTTEKSTLPISIFDRRLAKPMSYKDTLDKKPEEGMAIYRTPGGNAKPLEEVRRLAAGEAPVEQESRRTRSWLWAIFAAANIGFVLAVVRSRRTE